MAERDINRDTAWYLTMKDLDYQEGIIPLNIGVPGPDQLCRVKDIIGQATQALQNDLVNSDGILLQYGAKIGDLRFRTQLASFLTQQTGFSCDKNNLFVTGGTSSGLFFATSFFFPSGSTVFVEDPTYFAAINMLTDDLRMKIVPVPTDNDGLIVDELEKLVIQHGVTKASDGVMFASMLYTIPTFHNPTGRCLHPDRCKQLVKLARKYNMLLFADDVYEVLNLDNLSKPPPRLITYDNSEDGDYQGHVISCGSISKILAPGIRVGWIEAGDRIIDNLLKLSLLRSGGSLNQFGAAVLGHILKLDLLKPHVDYLRDQFKMRVDTAFEILAQKLPAGAKAHKPQGGYFIWIELPTTVDTREMIPYIQQHKHVSYTPGAVTSACGNYGNCLRISFGYLQRETLAQGLHALCDGINDYMAQQNKQ